jgi:uncharacterized repeat protein (TIGR02543 family)
MATGRYQVSLATSAGVASAAGYIHDGYTWQLQGDSFAVRTPATVRATCTLYEGYTFLGWYDQHGVCVSTSQTYAFNVEYDVSYTAKAAKKDSVYTVTYDVDGDTSKIAPTASAEGTADTKTAVLSTDRPTKHGYRFIGWSATKGSNTAEFKSGATVSLTGSVTLYAVWAACELLLYYGAAGKWRAVEAYLGRGGAWARVAVGHGVDDDWKMTE